MVLHDGADDREAKARVAAGRPPRGIDPIEAVEQPRQMLGGDAGSVIRDFENDAVSAAEDADEDLAAGGLMADGVGNEIPGDDGQRIGIRMAACGLELRVEPDLMLIGERLEKLDGVDRDGGEVQRLAPEFRAVVLAGQH